METFRKLNGTLRWLLVAAALAVCVSAQARTLAEVDSIVGRIVDESRATDRYVSMDSAEMMTLGFLQSVGDLHIIHSGGFAINGQLVLVDRNELANIGKWYKANRRFFSDRMYDEYVAAMNASPLAIKTDFSSFYYYPPKDSDSYRNVIPVIRRLNGEFLKAKYDLE